MTIWHWIGLLLAGAGAGVLAARWHARRTQAEDTRIREQMQRRNLRAAAEAPRRQDGRR